MRKVFLLTICLSALISLSALATVKPTSVKKKILNGSSSFIEGSAAKELTEALAAIYEKAVPFTTSYGEEKFSFIANDVDLSWTWPDPTREFSHTELNFLDKYNFKPALHYSPLRSYQHEAKTLFRILQDYTTVDRKPRLWSLNIGSLACYVKPFQYNPDCLCLVHDKSKQRKEIQDYRSKSPAQKQKVKLFFSDSLAANRTDCDKGFKLVEKTYETYYSLSENYIAALFYLLGFASDPKKGLYNLAYHPNLMVEAYWLEDRKLHVWLEGKREHRNIQYSCNVSAMIAQMTETILANARGSIDSVDFYFNGVHAEPSLFKTTGRNNHKILRRRPWLEN